MIPLTPKEVFIRTARRVFGEKRVHDYLIKRGIKLRHLNEGYENSDTCSEVYKVSENHEYCENRQTLVFMADGKWMHGGLTDRLRGMTSAYKFAKEHNLDFKIFHTSPFGLQEILQPNKVNWIIGENEISHNCEIAKPVLLYREDFNNDSALERQLDSNHKQFHLYSCVDTVGKEFPIYFNELFKPSLILEQELAHYGKLLGESYTAISFRFQNKLGDFKEYVLKKETPHPVGHEKSDTTLRKTLVTADSPTFLAEAEKLPNVVTVKGKSIHIDFNGSKNATDYLKAFTEFFLISRASKAKLYRNRKFKTYPSNFPKYASLLGNVPYEIVED